ncbi:hypothetical protein BB561_000432 [Smittium simulii]|uniref:histidine--tRNA ligase n=1 Tax=Smittium simulii TaxID=133385 RepID=A0A2T9YZ25_9FUNG|nr:hypothetical protein BB561_000432 [Smittium simulii]
MQLSAVANTFTVRGFFLNKFSRNMSQCRNIRGMLDKLDQDLKKKKVIVDTAENILRAAGYNKIETPILEYTSTFLTGVGETSDIASKEMYCFEDRNGTSVALRPEGTAGVTRAFITNNLYKNLPQKLYYTGPMFRYERPQRGRYRQFDQFGVEVYGIHSPTADIEVLLMAWEFIKKLDLAKNSIIKLNSLGDKKTRIDYTSALVKYLQSKKEKLSSDSIIRLEKNPLRILDSKNPDDIDVLLDAPKISNFYNDYSEKRLAFIKSALDELGLAYELDEKLVRGLDYYDHTVWEFIYQNDSLGKSQDTILAGGRYNNLVKKMGCTYEVPGIGFCFNY